MQSHGDHRGIVWCGRDPRLLQEIIDRGFIIHFLSEVSDDRMTPTFAGCSFNDAEPIFLDDGAPDSIRVQLLSSLSLDPRSPRNVQT